VLVNSGAAVPEKGHVVMIDHVILIPFATIPFATLDVCDLTICGNCFNECC
jgi:hypothetical protein